MARLGRAVTETVEVVKEVAMSEEEIARAAAKLAMPKLGQAKAKASASKKAAGKPKGKQSSMMSFFAKKK